MKKSKKKIISNTFYTIVSALLMNGVLQLIVNPILNKYMGDEQMGLMLYIMGLVAIVCPTVGQALNTSRLIVRRDYEISNGDYNVLLLIFSSICICVTMLAAQNTIHTVLDGSITTIIILLTIFRYYGDVEYRLNLNYKNYLYYYSILTIGYLLGLGLFFVMGKWFWVYLIGEGAALLYLSVTGTIFKGFFKTTEYFVTAFQRGGILVFSYLINNITLNIDRLVLKNMIGNEAVTQYYVVSLIGKTMVILVAPINTIMISYLTKKKENIDRKQYMMLVGIGAIVSIVFLMCAIIATPVFIKLFYGNKMYNSVKIIMIWVNIGQVLNMYAGFLLMLILSFTKEKWQIILQVVHLIVMVVLVLICTYKYGIIGFAISSLFANAFRVFAVFIIGFLKINDNKEVTC